MLGMIANLEAYANPTATNANTISTISDAEQRRRVFSVWQAVMQRWRQAVMLRRDPRMPRVGARRRTGGSSRSTVQALMVGQDTRSHGSGSPSGESVQSLALTKSVTIS